MISNDTFEISDFLKSICTPYPNLLLYLREPCEPNNVPKDVKLGFCGLSAQTLFDFGTLVSNLLQLSGDIRIATENHVVCDSRLAIEIIVKLFYISDFEYEIKERITAIDPEVLPSIFLEMGQEFSVDFSLMNSSTFFQKFEKFVTMNHVDDDRKLFPLTFIKLIAKKGSARGKTAML